MAKKKQAWIYCSVDAPEDSHGVLKEQFRQLCDYAEQMSFETVGSSSDCGGGPLCYRFGFRDFMETVRKGEANVLLVISRKALSHSTIQLAWLQAEGEKRKLEIWSPQEGRIL